LEKIEKELEELKQSEETADSSKQKEDNESANKNTTDLESELLIEEELNSQIQQLQTQNQNLSNANLKSLMDAFINELPNCVNRELVDKAAKEFCLNLNTKLNRKRLVNALFQVQRTRLDLFAFYARLVAILFPLMPEISQDLSTLLLKDFRFHVRKKDQINIESKIKTARFIGELVKFNMFSKLDALNCLKTLLADFKHHNIEMFCNMLDVCGRFLYRNQETHFKLKLILEIVMRKKQAAMSMDNRYTIMIENAFYYCNPPESKQVEKKEASPLHEYVKKILYKDLNKLNVEKVKLNWTHLTKDQYSQIRSLRFAFHMSERGDYRQKITKIVLVATFMLTP
jgi:regulator of nonsense transcripts 2